jgi:hypothetical protein
MILSWSTNGSQIRRNRNPPPKPRRAGADIDIIEVHKEPLVESSHFLERSDSPHHHRSIKCRARPDRSRHAAYGDTVLHPDTTVSDEAGRVRCIVRPTEDWANSAEICIFAHQSVKLLYLICRNANIVCKEKDELRTPLHGTVDASIHTSDIPTIGG